MSAKTKFQMQQELEALKKRKQELLQLKVSSPKDFSEEAQSELDEIAEKIIDLEEQIELATTTYTPAPGTEKLVHLKIVNGRRFDENTGEEISKPYVQKFTYGEYKNFVKNASLCGYTIIEVLHNPYKD